jgi:RNA polymerase sigma-70 factor, ECF subfamily
MGSGTHPAGKIAHPIRKVPIQREKENVLSVTSSVTRDRDGNPDAAVLQRVRAGDRTAMAQVYDKYNRLVYSIALRILRDRSAAEDLLQDVFLRVWRKPQIDCPESGLGPWLAVVTRNGAIDMIRRRKPQAEVTEITFRSNSFPDKAAEMSQFVDRARVVMETLDANQRAAVELAFFEGLTHTEIAERTGAPLGTVKTRLRSAIQTLRRAMQ